MNAVGSTLRLDITNRLDALNEAIERLDAFLEAESVPLKLAYAARLTLEELATNMIKYGYDDDAEHLIRFTISVHPDHLKIVFEDDGHPFDPTRYPSPDVERIVRSSRIGGLGIELVRRVTSRMTYERDGRINRNTLHIRRMEPGDTQVIRLNL